MSSHSVLRIRLFGPFEVSLGDTPIGPLRSRTVQWLLALLVLRHGRDIERSWLAGMLWPESANEQALGNLRQSLTNLRSVLGDEAQRLTAPTARTLRFDLDGADVDVLRFDAAVTRGELTSLEEAVELYRGPLLADCKEEWVPQEREQRVRGYVGALEGLARAAGARGDHSEAAACYRRIIAVEPLRESRYGALLEALAAGGDFTAAMDTYRELRERLRSELNLKPSGATEAVYERLRSEARERASGTAAPAETTALPEAPIRRLPRPLTELIGRERELEAIRGALDRSRLVSLMGAGGIGKTRLSIHVADAAAPDFPDGAWFVDLAPVLDPNAVESAVAQALELREAPSVGLSGVIRAHLRNRRLLLILDNCEQVLETAAHLTERLLSDCPGLHVLVTSRQPLGIPGEGVIRVPSLGLPPEDLRPPGSPAAGAAAMESLLEYDAVRLFTERAAALAPHFQVSAENVPAIVQICRRLDGIPLAIELAAARTRVLTPQKIAERLDDRFRLLVGGSRTALPRQQTLDAAVSWSYELLSEAERTALRRLSVCAGGWTLRTARVLLGTEELPEIAMPDEVGAADDWEAVDLLNQLIDKSLVLTIEAPAAGAGGAENSEPPELRYGMLETIRQYALERLRESGEEDTVRARYAAWFAGVALEAQPHFATQHQVIWLQRLSRDLENLRQAVRWCETHGSPERSLRLTTALARVWTWLGLSTEGREWISRSVARCPDPPANLGASAWGSLATLAWFQSDFAAAREAFEKCLELWRSIGDRRGEGYALNNLGLTASRQGDLDGAWHYYEQGLALFREMDERRGIANALHNLGSVARMRDDLPAARRLLEEGLAVGEALGDFTYVQTIKNTLGLVARREGRLEEALRLLQEVLVWDGNAGDRRGVASAKHNLGLILRDLGRNEEARQHQEEALALGREVEDRVIVAAALHNLSQLALLRGDVTEAAELCGESLLIAVQLEDRVGIAGSLEAYAELALLFDRAPTAAKLLGAAARLREEAGAPVATPDRPSYQQVVDSARERLGAEACEVAWSSGAAAPLEAVTAEALALRELR